MQSRTTSEYDAVVSHAGLSSSNVLRLTSLPVGWQGRPCPSCHESDLQGALISPSADEEDPDIFCTSCSCYF